MRKGMDVPSHGSVARVCLALGVPIFAATVMLGGCTSELGILECQKLPEETVQYVDLQVDSERAWQAISAKISSDPACERLSRSDTDRLISWREEVKSWRDFSYDAYLIGQTPPLSSGANPRKFEKMIKKDLDKMAQPGIGITTVWVQPLGSGCRVNVRRTYYGPGSVAGLGHSRGDYEREFLNGIGGL